MVYQSNIPQPGDLISDSQSDILGNFQAIKTAFDINHVTFDTAGQGKHNFVEMPVQGSDPAGAATELTLFSKTISGATQLFYKRDAEANSHQLTGPNPTNATKGCTFLPGGLLLQWNTENTVANNQQYTFLQAFSAVPYSIILTGVRSNSDVRSLWVSQGNVTASNFRIKTNSTGVALTPVYWMAIGPA